MQKSCLSYPFPEKREGWSKKEGNELFWQIGISITFKEIGDLNKTGNEMFLLFIIKKGNWLMTESLKVLLEIY